MARSSSADPCPGFSEELLDLVDAAVGGVCGLDVLALAVISSACALASFTILSMSSFARFRCR